MVPYRRVRGIWLVSIKREELLRWKRKEREKTAEEGYLCPSESGVVLSGEVMINTQRFPPVPIGAVMRQLTVREQFV